MASNQSNFYKAISRTLDSWTAFQLAIRQGFGGVYTKEKATWLIDVTEQWFLENSDIKSYELEDFISEILSNEFDLIVDDGSLHDVCDNIVDCYTLCRKKKLDELEIKLTKLPTANVDHCRLQKNEDDDDGDDEDMETEIATSSQVMSQGATAQPTSTTSSSQQNGDGASHDIQMQEEEDDGWTVVRKSKKR